MAVVDKLKNILSQNRIIILIVLVTFLLSVAYSFHFRIVPAVDARAYDNIAQNIAAGYGYKEDATLTFEQDFAIARVGPLYEYFLAGIYKIFGHSYDVVWVAQALLRALTVWLIYLIVLLILKDKSYQRKSGLLSAAFVAFYPDLIEISAMLLTETLYLFLFCLMLYLFFRHFEENKVWLASTLGFFSSLSVLARPPVLFLMPVVAFLYYSKKRFLTGLVFCLFFLLTFVPWAVRNYQVYHEFMPLGAAGAYNFWIGNYHGANGEQSPTKEQGDFTASHPIKEIQAESIKQFKVFVYNYPAEFVKITLLRINKYFSIARPIGFWFYQHGVGQMLVVGSSALASIVLFVLGLGGLFVALFRSDNQKLKYLGMLTVVTPLILFITVVETRYRFQIYPLLAILAGYFVFWLVEQGDWRKNKVLRITLAVILLNAATDLLLNVDKLKEKIGGFF